MSSIPYLSIAQSILGAGNTSEGNGPDQGTAGAASLFGNATKIANEGKTPAAAPAATQQQAPQLPAAQLGDGSQNMYGSPAENFQDSANATIEGGLGAANGVTAGAMRKVDKAGQGYANAALGLGQAQQHVLDEFAPKMGEVAKGYAELDQKYQQTVDIAQQKTTQQMKAVMASAQRIQDYQFQDFWADKSTAGKVIGIIAQALGGAANGLAGQPGAPTPLDRIIERDMQLQMANFNKARAANEAQSGVLQQMRGELGDILSAQAAFRQGAQQKMQLITQEMAARMNVPAAKAQEVAASIGFTSAQTLGNMTQSISHNIFNAALQEAGIAQSQAQLDLQSTQLRAQMQERADQKAQIDNRSKAKLEVSANAAIQFAKVGDDMDKAMRNNGVDFSHTYVKAKAIQLAEYAFRAQNPGAAAKLSDDVIHNIGAQAGIRFVPGTNDVAYVDPKAFAEFRATVGDQIKNQSIMAGQPGMYDQYREQTDRQ